MAAEHGREAAHIRTGMEGEAEVLRRLTRQGFRLCARNWRPRQGAGKLELDLVGHWEGSLVFVEVKTRRLTASAAQNLEGPAGLYAFTPDKRRNMVRAARAYLTEKNAWETPCRFDLACVTFLSGNGPRMDYYRDVIELGQTLDSGNPPWQPW